MTRRFILILTLLAAACRERAPSPRNASARAPEIGFVDESAVGAPRDGGTLYRRLEGEPSTLNPILQTDDYEAFVLSEVERNLVEFDKDMKPAAGLCDRWEVSRDLKSFRFHLRDDAVWEDGAPVTADDAVFTIRAIVNPKIPAVFFAPNFEGLERIEKLDPKTFRVDFREPYAMRIYAFALPLLPAHRLQGRDLVGAPENRAPLSNGPYRVASWKTSESIELSRNERYAGPRGHFDRVVFRILPDSTQAFRALESGEIDEMRLSADQWRASQTDPGFSRCCRSTLFYDLSFFYIGYNNRSPLFSDALTRRAMTRLLDRSGIVKNLLFGTGRILSGPWPADSPAYDATVAPEPFDPEGARRMLAEAGWKDSDGDGILERAGHKFDFELLYGSGSASARPISEIFRERLARAGINCRPQAVEWAAFTKRIDAGEFEAVADAWSAADPNPDIYSMWHSSQAPPNGLNNLSYSNPEADRLLVEARTEPDAQKRLTLYHRLHRVLHDDSPATFVLQSAQKFAVSKRIGGLVTTPLGPFKFWPGAAGWWDRGSPRP
jgi:peptide/nickel transport system substrate-binding protein